MVNHNIIHSHDVVGCVIIIDSRVVAVGGGGGGVKSCILNGNGTTLSTYIFIIDKAY